MSRFLFVLFLFLSINTSSQNCKNIPAHFSSYKEAVSVIKSNSYKFTDYINTEKSSWMLSAFYFSCDGVSGYLIIRTKTNKEYLHKEVPLLVWYNFKRAESFGQYYNSNIKGRYKFDL